MWYQAGCRCLEDVRARADALGVTQQQRIGLELHADFKRRIPRAEVEETVGIVRSTTQRVLQVRRHPTAPACPCCSARSRLLAWLLAGRAPAGVLAGRRQQPSHTSHFLAHLSHSLTLSAPPGADGPPRRPGAPPAARARHGQLCARPARLRRRRHHHLSGVSARQDGVWCVVTVSRQRVRWLRLGQLHSIKRARCRQAGGAHQHDAPHCWRSLTLPVPLPACAGPPARPSTWERWRQRCCTASSARASSLT